MALQIQIILEVLGRPPENVKEALVSLITKLASESGVKVLEKKFHEPVQTQSASNLYTAFAEATLELESLERYFDVLFAYMPSHTELIYPEHIALDNNALNQFAGKLLNRMHGYDAVVKNMLVERDIILKRVKEDAPALFQELTSLSAKPEQKKATASKSPHKKKNTKKKEVR